MTAQEVCEALQLAPLGEEGGRFRQTFKSPLRVKTDLGLDRSAGTAIYYLITPGDYSLLHRVRHDEVFHFYAGTPVELVRITPAGVYRTFLGSDFSKGQVPQFTVAAGQWQGLRLAAAGEWALLGATTSPGYEQEDFELGRQSALLEEMPQHSEAIIQFTRA